MFPCTISLYNYLFPPLMFRCTVFLQLAFAFSHVSLRRWSHKNTVVQLIFIPRSYNVRGRKQTRFSCSQFIFVKTSRHDLCSSIQLLCSIRTLTSWLRRSCVGRVLSGTLGFLQKSVYAWPFSRPRTRREDKHAIIFEFENGIQTWWGRPARRNWVGFWTPLRYPEPACFMNLWSRTRPAKLMGIPSIPRSAWRRLPTKL